MACTCSDAAAPPVLPGVAVSAGDDAVVDGDANTSGEADGDDGVRGDDDGLCAFGKACGACAKCAANAPRSAIR